MTRQRRIILEELRKVFTHPTADELYKAARKRLPRISLSTVYRNLELLCREGAIRKLEMAGSQKRFDGNLKDHYHIRCLRCGRVADIELERRPDLEGSIRGVYGFEVLGHRLELTGVCGPCMAGRRSVSTAC
ncbi:MAG: transcriptional repressor [Elusimicrobiota bacterium]